MGGKGFSVNLTKKDLVVPVAAFTRQDHVLPQSNLDLLFRPRDVCFFFCYRKHDLFTFESQVNILKKSLARVLVPYYVFAGEMVVNSLDESIRDKMLPDRNQRMFCVQATELRCGGLLVACNYDHRVADAYSANMFFLSWAETAQSEHISILPTFERSLIAPRRPLIHNSSLENMYIHVSEAAPPQDLKTPNSGKRVSRMYYVDADQIRTLQALANADNVRDMRTKLEAFCAFLWRITNADELHRRKTSTLGFLVDGRTRLSDGKLEMSNKMNTYFGNCVCTAFGKKVACELNDRPLNWVADAIHEFLKPVSTKGHFMDLVDLIEAHRPHSIMPKVSDGGGYNEDDGRLMVSSCLGLRLCEVNFGWGKPILGSFHLPRGIAGDVEYVYPMRSPVRKGDWIILMNMFEERLDLVEKHAAGIFKPLTVDYLSVSERLVRAAL